MIHLPAGSNDFHRSVHAIIGRAITVFVGRLADSSPIIMTALVTLVSCAASAFSPAGSWHNLGVRPNVAMHPMMSQEGVRNWRSLQTDKILPMNVGIASREVGNLKRKSFLAEIIDSIDEVRARLAACDNEEECALEYATALEGEIKAGESMSDRVDAAKRHAQHMATVAQVRDKASDARDCLKALHDEKQGAREPRKPI